MLLQVPVDRTYKSQGNCQDKILVQLSFQTSSLVFVEHRLATKISSLSGSEKS